MHKPKGILVTGTHRSGTTWVGRIISLSPGIVYIHEPFNAQCSAAAISYQFKHWFSYVEDLEDKEDFLKAFEATLDFRHVPSLPLSKISDFHALKRYMRNYIDNLSHRIRKRVPLIKDPIALLSAEFLASNFDLSVICMIRHPLAFCGSLKKWNWSFAFSNLLNQGCAIEKYFPDEQEEIERFSEEEQDIVSQAILLWSLLHKVIKMYQETHPDWMFVRHEDLVADPIGGFKRIYEKMGLAFRNNIKEGILNLTNSTEEESDVPSFMARNLSSVTETWKKRLDADEVERIIRKTTFLRNHFYPERDGKLINF
ncbi:MAG: hypothetical protein BMS9Abin05_2602 [Rhodothermia bacterium]|nr:MAG: hypothetical protein BMS9Abin05_2602 [Rhodothermia bacterium]